MLKNLTLSSTVWANGEEIFATIESVVSTTEKGKFELRVSLPNFNPRNQITKKIANELGLTCGKDFRSDSWYTPEEFKNAVDFNTCSKNAIKWVEANQNSHTTSQVVVQN